MDIIQFYKIHPINLFLSFSGENWILVNGNKIKKDDFLRY